jgi:putative oxidoreductase
MFPNGIPGVGLLFLRVVAGSLLIHEGFYGLPGIAMPAGIARQMIGAGAGVFLIFGLWTPIVGSLVLILQLWIISGGIAHADFAIALAGIAGALAMLGPGAYAIDSLFYGRKRIEIGER